MTLQGAAVVSVVTVLKIFFSFRLGSLLNRAHELFLSMATLIFRELTSEARVQLNNTRNVSAQMSKVAELSLSICTRFDF